MPLLSDIIGNNQSSSGWGGLKLIPRYKYNAYKHNRVKSDYFDSIVDISSTSYRINRYDDSVTGIADFATYTSGDFLYYNDGKIDYLLLVHPNNTNNINRLNLNTFQWEHLAITNDVFDKNSISHIYKHSDGSNRVVLCQMNHDYIGEYNLDTDTYTKISSEGDSPTGNTYYFCSAVYPKNGTNHLFVFPAHKVKPSPLYTKESFSFDLETHTWSLLEDGTTFPRSGFYNNYAYAAYHDGYVYMSGGDHSYTPYLMRLDLSTNQWETVEDDYSAYDRYLHKMCFSTTKLGKEPVLVLLGGNTSKTYYDLRTVDISNWTHVYYNFNIYNEMNNRVQRSDVAMTICTNTVDPQWESVVFMGIYHNLVSINTDYAINDSFELVIEREVDFI